ncbi:tagatose-6-phosphate kinase [Virgibacillus siamensis]|uniref:Tagatose-6-phosphate kinase n=1 Tax=Virgibacillus siamensis TaxID=480071 RepID=A0ABN1FIC9_9BACI
MILTVTLNPSVDISYRSDTFSLDKVNRIADVSKTAGGKGLNVARVLRQLGEDTAATGFLGGSLGAFIRTGISSQGIKDFFVKIDGETRNCIAVIHEGRQTEILEAGPSISKNESSQFIDAFSEYVQNVEVVTISGSLPKGLVKDFYAKLIKTANSNDTPVLLDTKGELLARTLEHADKPWLIKPNLDELADLVGEKPTDEKQICDALKQIKGGVPWVVVTTGALGAFVKHEETLYRVGIPAVDAVNPVGSGDAVMAGFAAGLAQGLKGETFIKYGLAMGVLNAMEAQTGFVNPEKVSWCMEQIRVDSI